MKIVQKIQRSIPNILTVARLFGVFFASMLMFSNELADVLVALMVYILVAITDLLDGYLARRWNAVSVFGAIMDPIADKVYILTLYISFVFLQMLAHWWIWPIIVREVSVTVTRFVLLQRGCVVAAEKSGKIKTLTQNISVFLLYFLFLGTRFFDWSDDFTRIVEGITYLALGLAVFYTISSGKDFFVNNWDAIKKKKLA
jgi:CDP-diacylglycerol--glycerol-3-phosphate 3-phosphatidyltransferase